MPSAPFPKPPTVPILGAFLLAVLTSGCPTRNEIGPGRDAGDAGDGGDVSDSGGQIDGSPQPDGPPGIAIVAPASLTYVSGIVRVEVEVTGGTATNVQLLRNGTSWQTLSGPPFVYSWDTAGEPDDNYILTAKATVSGQAVASLPESRCVGRAARAKESLRVAAVAIYDIGFELRSGQPDTTPVGR